ncbi:hypothetical protein AKO1_000707, partial [Acrasis kona]
YLLCSDKCPDLLSKEGYYEHVVTASPIVEPPISLENVGHLSCVYFLPWKLYEPKELINVIFPWSLQQTHVNIINCIKKRHFKMYSIMNRKLGLICIDSEASRRELIGMKIEELEKKSGTDKRHTFYENERRRFLERRVKEDGKALVSELRQYSLQQTNKQRLSEFINK